MAAEMLSNVELVFWNMPASHQPTVAKVRETLAAHGLNPERAEDVAASTAFRRAGDDIRDKTMLVRNHKDFIQIDKESKEEGKRKIKRRMVGSYYLNGDGIAAEEGSDYSVQNLLNIRFNHNKETYVWGDVTRTIIAILSQDGLGVYTPRRSGGVYFCPFADNSALLNRVEEFCAALGMRFLRYKVPGSDTQKAEVSEAIEGAMMDELETHAKAVADYSADTKPGVVENRWEALRVTAEHILRVIPFLGNEARVRLNKRMEEIEEALAKAEKVSEEAAATTAKKRGKIVGVN